MERSVILAIYGFLVQVIIPSGKRYFYIRAGLSRFLLLEGTLIDEGINTETGGMWN